MTFQINALNPSELHRFGKQILYDYGRQFNTFEGAARQCVIDVFDQFVEEDGSPDFALMRIFRAGKCDEVPPHLYDLIEDPQLNYLCLMGTYGLEPAWCDRLQSKSHQAIPIDAQMSPMFRGVFREMGFQFDDPTGDLVPEGMKGDMAMIRYFHVPDASSSTFITDHESFVQPYGIKSVVAFGSSFLSGSAFTLIAFSQHAISQDDAASFAELTTYIATLLATYEARGTLWE